MRLSTPYGGKTSPNTDCDSNSVWLQNKLIHIRLSQTGYNIVLFAITQNCCLIQWRKLINEFCTDVWCKTHFFIFSVNKMRKYKTLKSYRGVFYSVQRTKTICRLTRCCSQYSHFISKFIWHEFNLQFLCLLSLQILSLSIKSAFPLPLFHQAQIQFLPTIPFFSWPPPPLPVQASFCR